jgi:signal transduction histidine kinase
LIEALAPTASMVVPLVARGRTLGVISFVAAESGRRYDPADLALAEEVARRAALALDNARLYADLQEAVRTRDQFLSIASHELKTPVTAVYASLQLLQRAQSRGPVEPERLARSVDRMLQATTRLIALNNDLLDVARIRLGQLPLHRQALDLAALARSVAGRFQEELDPAHRLALDLGRDARLVEADPDRLEQVLTNLLDNAAKYSPDGGTITITVGREAGGARLAVRDEGIGLPPGTEETIFEPFGRAPNAAARHLPGLGLGLYICRTIAERHGGWLRAASPGEGRGTTRTLWLPDG